MTFDLAKYAQSAQDALELVESMVVQTQPQLDAAAKTRQTFAAVTKEVKAARETEKRPHLDANAAADKKFGPVIKALERCDKILQDKIALALAAQREVEHRARLELQASVNQAGGQADVSEGTVVLAHGRDGNRLHVPEGSRETSISTFVVEDEALVPAEYKRTCTELVMAEIERTRGACKIPGIKVVREFSYARKGVVQR